MPTTNKLRVWSLSLLALGTFSCADSLETPFANITPVADARVMGNDSRSPSFEYTGKKVIVTLDGSHSRDPDGSINTYRWLSSTPRMAAAGAMGAMGKGTGNGAGPAAAGTDAAGAGGAAAGSSAAGSGGASAGTGAAAGTGGAAGTSAAGTSAAGTSAAGMGGAGKSSAGASAAGSMAAAGRAAAAGGGGSAAKGSGRWVPEGKTADWPDDVMQPVVELDQGVYSFTLWVVDDKGVISEPSTITVTIEAALDPAVQMCVNTVLPTVKRSCSACVCGVSDDCKAAANMSACGADCWNLISCIGTMCPTFSQNPSDTSCLVQKCSAYLGGGAAAQKIGPCITGSCGSACTAD